MSADGSLHYSPPDDLRSGEVGEDVFTYTVSDGEETATATVTVVVIGRNDPPTVNLDAPPVQVSAGEPVTVIEVSDIFADADLGDNLTIVELDASNTRGTITIGSIFYEPGSEWDFLGEGEIGHDSFFIRVEDDEGASAATTYTFDIIGVNDAPVTQPDLFDTVEGVPVSGNVLSNDSDPDGELITAVPGAAPEHGTLTLSEDGNFTYEPDAGFSSGTDTFSYIAFDASGGTTEEFVTISISPNQPPEFIGASGQDIFSEEPFILDLGSLFFDPDSSDLTITASTAAGFVTISGNQLVANPTALDAGTTASVELTVSDGINTTNATVTLNVVKANAPPELISPIGSLSVIERDNLNVDLLSHFGDPDGDPLTFTVSGDAPFATISGSTLMLMPSTGDASSYSVTVTADDGRASVTETFSLSVTAADDPPVADDESFTIVEGGIGNETDLDAGSSLLDGDYDPDGDPLTVVATPVIAPAYGTLSLFSSGSFIYTHDGSENYSDSFVYQVSDGVNTDTATVTITITPVNDNAPFVSAAGPGTVRANDGDSVNFVVVFTDLDGDSLTITALDLPAGVTATPVQTGTITTVTVSGTVSGSTDHTIQLLADDGINPVTSETITFFGGVANSPPTGLISLTGNAEVGSSVGINTSALSDPNGLGGFSYQWYLDHTVIGGATSATYTPTVGDVHKDLSVEVRWTDGDGFQESMLSVAEEVFIQNPMVSGDVNYNLNPSFMDYINGDATSDTVTLIGAAESGDFIDLHSGSDQVVLDSSVPNNVSIKNVEVITGGATHTDTVNIYGELLTPAGIFGGLQNNDVINNHGTIFVDGLSTSFGGTFNNNTGSKLELGGTDPTTVTLGVFPVNDGSVVLDGEALSTLNVSTGTVLNKGTIVSRDTSTRNDSFNVVDADIQNSGSNSLIQVSHDLRFSSSQVDIREGTVIIDSSETLQLSNSDLVIDSDSQLLNGLGANNGTVSLINNSKILIDGSHTLKRGSPDLDFSNGTVQINQFSGSATFQVDASATVELSEGDSINTALVNHGDIVVVGSGNNVTGTVVQSVTGRIFLTADGVDGNAALTFTQALVNDGTLVLDNVDSSSFSSTLTIAGSGQLTNDPSGRIRILDSDDSSTGHDLDARLVNDGEIFVETALDLIASGVSHVNNGTIVMDGATIDVTSAASFVVSSTGKIEGSGTIMTTGSLVVNGTLGPEEPFMAVPSASTIGINGPLEIGSTGRIELDVFSATSFDQVTLSGGSLTLSSGSTLRLLFEPGHSLSNGGFLDNVITTQASISGGFTTVQHNLGSAYTVTAASDGTNIDVTITVSGSVRDFDVAGSDLDWGTPVNWDSSDTLPIGSDDVRIGTVASYVSYTGAGPASVNSLTLLAGSSLDIESANLTLETDSAVFDGATLALEGGTLTSSALLTVFGTLDWGSGTLDGTGSVDVLGTFDMNLTANSTLNLFLNLEGTSQFDAVARTLTGTGSINNDGSLTIIRTPTIDVRFKNDKEGTVTIKGDTAIADVDISQDYDNFGTLIIDSFSGGGAATLEMVASTLSNMGTVRFQDTSGTAPVLTLDTGDGDTFFNQGYIDVDADAVINITSSMLDTRGGRIDIAGATTLTIQGGDSSTAGTFRIDGGTTITGTPGTSVIAFTGQIILDVPADSLLDTPVTLDTTGATVTVSGAGELHIGNNTTFTLNSGDSVALDDGDQVSNDLVNFGTLKLLGNDIHIQSSFQNNGVLNVSGGGANFTMFEHSFVNNGTVQLVQDGGAGNQMEVNNSGGIGSLTNNNLFQSAQTGADTQQNLFRGIFINNGTMDVQYGLELNESSGVVQHVNNGTISIDSGQTLRLGANNDLDNHEGAVIKGFGTLDVSGTNVDFINDGVILPGGTGVVGTLSIDANANTVLSEKSQVEIDLASAATFDVLAFMGSAPNLGGRLDILKGFVLANGYSFTVLTSVAALASSFDYVKGTDHFVSDGVIIDVTQNTNDITLDALSVTLAGTAGNDGLVNTSGVDVIHAGDGDDSIDIGSFSSSGDIVFGGKGDDFIEADDAGFKRIVGGEGIDTLKLTANTDYRTFKGHQLEELEVIYIDDGGVAQTIELDGEAIRRVSDGRNDLTGLNDSLVVVGDSQDKVILYGDFSEAGHLMLDARNPGVFEEFTTFTDSLTGSHLIVDEKVELEIRRSGGEVHRYGSEGADTLSGTANDDILNGRLGDDVLTGLGGADLLKGDDGVDDLDGGAGVDRLFGGDDDDTLHYDAADTKIDGGFDIDTLLVNGTIDLSGVTSIDNIEWIDMQDGAADTLTVNTSDILNFVGDNSLDRIINDGAIKMIIEGDTVGTDTLILNGNDLSDINGLQNGLSSDFTEQDYFGTGNMYVKFTSGSVDVYVHANLVDDTPM